MSTTLALEDTNFTNPNFKRLALSKQKTKAGEVKTHPLGISKDQLIPRNCKNCHCLQAGLQADTLVLLVQTDDSKEWIICTPSKSKNILAATVHLQMNGISEDRNETATSVKIVEKRGCESLFNLLNEMKSPNLALERVRNDSGNLVAFYLS